MVMALGEEEGGKVSILKYSEQFQQDIQSTVFKVAGNETSICSDLINGINGTHLELRALGIFK